MHFPIKRIIAQTSNPSALVGVLFEARNRAHELHLKTQSYSVHKALEELYEALLEHADKFAETAQGKYGVLQIEMHGTLFEDSSGAIQFLSILSEWLNTTGKASINPIDTFLLNQLDEIVATVYRAKYKVENLK